MWYVVPKYWAFSKLHSITTQKTVLYKGRLVWSAGYIISLHSKSIMMLYETVVSQCADKSALDMLMAGSTNLAGMWIYWQ
jgi:uncharacterized protein YrrD